LNLGTMVSSDGIYFTIAGVNYFVSVRIARIDMLGNNKELV
jgi:hypothetical protein